MSDAFSKWLMARDYWSNGLVSRDLRSRRGALGYPADYFNRPQSWRHLETAIIARILSGRLAVLLEPIAQSKHATRQDRPAYRNTRRGGEVLCRSV